MNLSLYFAEKSALIEKHLDQLVPEQTVPYNALYQAARYSLLGGGKRLRPLLVLATAEMLGVKDLQALSAACALELIHTYSLIHDDLPCMDNDDFRRGKPSLHKKYSEGHAVLTGDFLLTHAFEIVVTDSWLSSEQKVQLVHTLATQSGGPGMIGGQLMDIQAEGKKIDLETLQTIHHYKTGALITASITCGAIIAEASSRDLEHLQKFGNDIGLAFQIIDDVLDVTASNEKHGKAVASDFTNNKSTYVSLLGLEKAQQTAEALYLSAIEHLGNLSCDTHLLEQIAAFVIYRKH